MEMVRILYKIQQPPLVALLLSLIVAISIDLVAVLAVEHLFQ